MPVPHSTGNFGDLIDKRVSKIFYDTYKQLPDRIADFYNMESSSDSFEKNSGIGSLGDFSQFAGTVTYQSQAQAYDTTATHVPFANGIQIERELYDDDRHGIWEKRPMALAQSAQRTRQKHAARLFNNAFSVDSYFYNNSEGVSLCSDSHTTNSGASTAAGFDNLVTSSLSAVAVTAARIQMRGFRGDVAERLSVMPSKLLIPIDLYEIAYEIAESEGKVDSANNNANVHKGKYEVTDWEYLTDTNNWFMLDGSAQKMDLTWYDRIPLEFAMAEELDTLIAKWRAYMRFSCAWWDWRFILGGNVS
jgi:phage major head subunit gpT-like protein